MNWLAIVFLIYLPEAFAQTERPNLEIWLQELTAEKMETIRNVKVAFIAKKDGKSIIPKEILPPESLSYLFAVVAQKDLNWNLKINQEDLKKNILKKIVKVSRANAIFELKETTTILHFANFKSREIAIGEKEAYQQPRKFWDLVVNNLGFNGIILDRKENYILVAEFGTSVNTDRRQAAICENSAGKVIFNKSPPGALLEASQQKKFYTIYEIIIGESNALVPGGKVITDQFNFSNSP